MDMKPEEQLRYNAVDLAIRAGAGQSNVVHVASEIERYIKSGAEHREAETLRQGRPLLRSPGVDAGIRA